MTRLRATLVIAALLTFSALAVRAHEESLEAIESFLHGLVDDGALSEAQHKVIDQFMSQGNLSALDMFLRAQETAARITRDTRLYVNALLGIGEPEVTQAAASASYSDNGNVTLLGRLDAQPPNPYYGDNSSTGTLYNGIWGYAVGSREYALQSNSFGLHIIDVTNPAAPFHVQYINMSGGVSPPNGRIWRDVDINLDPVSGKTYAYVGAQANGNFWVVDLSRLSGTHAARRRFESDPAGRDRQPRAHELRPHRVRQRRARPSVPELGQQRHHARLSDLRPAARTRSIRHSSRAGAGAATTATTASRAPTFLAAAARLCSTRRRDTPRGIA